MSKPSDAPIMRLALWSFYSSYLYPLLIVGFLTVVREYPAVLTGAVFTAAVIARVACSAPIGWVIDRYGSLRATQAFHLAAPLLFAAVFLANSIPLVFVTAIAASIAIHGCDVSRSTVISTVFTGPDRRAVSARMKVRTNTALLAATGTGALCFGFGVPGYIAGVIVVIITGLAGWVATFALPYDPAAEKPTAKGEKPASIAWKDARYLRAAVLVSLALGVMSIRSIGLPIYILTMPELPASLAGFAFIPGALIVILLQTRISERFDGLSAVKRAFIIGGVIAAAGFLALTAMSSVDTVTSVALLVVASVLFGFAETIVNSGAWAVRYDLIPEGAQHGSYQAAFITVGTVVGIPAPLTVGAALSAFGASAWLLFAGVMLVLCGVVAFIRWRVPVRAEG